MGNVNVVLLSQRNFSMQLVYVSTLQQYLIWEVKYLYKHIDFARQQ
jgi:hypothetical protein